MNTYYLRKIRKRFTIKKEDNPWDRWIIIDHKEKSVSNNNSWEQVMHTLLLAFTGFFTMISRDAKKYKRSEKVKYNRAIK